MKPDPEMIDRVARAISLSFHEEGYIEGVSHPSEWQEFVKAAEAVIAAMADSTKPDQSSMTVEQFFDRGYAHAARYAERHENRTLAIYEILGGSGGGYRVDAGWNAFSGWGDSIGVAVRAAFDAYAGLPSRHVEGRPMYDYRGVR